MLCEFAGLLRTHLRRMDTVGRWGGEEFVTILPEMQADEALALAETVLATVERAIGWFMKRATV